MMILRNIPINSRNVQIKLKDPVLPMILSGLTMNFMLYEKDYGLNRKALLSFQPSNESCEVIDLTQTKNLPKSN